MAQGVNGDARFRLDGRTAFVSAAAGHLGRAMSHVLASAGAHVIVNGRTEARTKSLADELSGEGFSVESAVFDVGDIGALREFFSRRPRLDVLVNNAVSMTPKPMAALEPEDFEVTYRSSVVAAFEAARAARPALKAAAASAGEASIINVSSLYALVSPVAALYARKEQASPLHYGPAKAALLQLTRHLAAELGPDRIRVNALVPGPFPHASTVKSDADLISRLASRTMLGRVGNADEIAGPLLFLASTASSFMTGASLTIDGGWTAW
jgi:NAD(P)-dependent dehydrogenase (short-subunit alcohol dehydrogenase family)